ncbi:hypothetical protein BGW42_004279 [Actinomortierella wolfii]|nr:hypothetical protein BGW42_004279 [Actinomortierella wolfii]
MADSADASVSTFLSSLVFTVGVSTALFVVYAIVRNRIPRVYKPKTYIGPAKIRPPDPNASAFSVKGILGWAFGERMLDEHGVVDRCGMDAFMFLEFLNKSFFLFLLFTCLAVPILIPINVVNQRGLDGLNQLTMGNVLDTQRLWAHLVLAVLFSGVVLWGSMRSIRRYIQRRQEYLMSDDRTQSLQATTILVCGIPEADCNVPRLQEIFGLLPGGVKRVWLAYQPGDLAKEVAERSALTNKLEAAECVLLRKKLKHHSAENSYRRQSLTSTNSRDMLQNNQNANNNGNDQSMDETFPVEKRPRHRPAKFPMTLFTACCGAEKVDSITAYRSELSNLNASILARQQATMAAMHDNNQENRLNAAFIQFHHQLAAHLAAQAVVHPKMLSMAPRLLEVHPHDVLWDNLGLSLRVRNVRKAISIVLAAALIIFWTIPVTFVASVAKLDVIVKYAPFLSGVYSLPTIVVGIIQGLLPPIGLAILMALLPIILYLTTLANGIFAAVNAIKDNPSKIMEMLATTLPQASTFFLSFILLAWIQVPMMLLQIGPLIMYLVGKMFAKTPRKVFANECTFSSVDWGMTVPVHTIAFAIGLIYSTIQPLILPIIVVYFGLFYLAYRHMFLYVYKQPFDSGGLIFPRIVDQVYIALVIYQLTMLGLFILQKDIAMSIIGFVLLIGTLMAIVISRSKVFKPLIRYLPMEMFDQESLAKVAPTTGSTLPASTRSGGGGLRIQTDPSVILESDINPISRPESFHEKAPYKDPSSPLTEPASRELYSPSTHEKPRSLRRFSGSHENTGDGAVDTSGGDLGSGVGVGSKKRSGTMKSAASVPSIRVENTAVSEEKGSPSHQSDFSMGNESQVNSVNQSNRPTTASYTSEKGGRGEATEASSYRNPPSQRLGYSMHDYSEDASLRVLGGGHPSVFSSSNAAMDRAVPTQYAYVHPAIWTMGQPIWLPKDPRGFAEIETLELANAGLPSTTDAATMDAKGKVTVDATQRLVAPGDLDWDI